MIEDAKRLQGAVKRLIDALKRQEALSGKDYSQMTQKQVQKNGADLSWVGMEIDKAKHEAHAAAVDCGLADPYAADQYGAVDYRPSSFHHYRYQPPLPRCRQKVAQ